MSATLRLGTQTGSVINHIMSGSKDREPEVGMGATILMWTDRVACTITEVGMSRRAGQPNLVVVREDRAIRTDEHGMSDAQSYRYEPDPKGRAVRFTLRKNGAWVKEGDSMKGERLLVGTRQHYHDYSF